MNKTKLSLTVQYAGDSDDAPTRPRARALVAAALSSWRGGSAQFVIRFVGEDEMATLNRQYRGKSGATNVLTFTYAADAADASDAADAAAQSDAVVGDVVICGVVARREALRYNIAASSRYAHLIVHGVLHAIGYDHIRADDRRKMEAREKTVLQKFNISDPYLWQPEKKVGGIG